MSYYNRHKRSRSNQRLRVDVNDSDDEEANLPDVILEGYLHKTVSRLGSRVRRFYVLSRTAAALLYFNTPEERFPSGFIPLEEIQSATSVEHKETEFFDLVTVDRTWHFQAKASSGGDSPDAQQWANAIEKLVSKHRRRQLQHPQHARVSSPQTPQALMEDLHPGEDEDDPLQTEVLSLLQQQFFRLTHSHSLMARSRRLVESTHGVPSMSGESGTATPLGARVLDERSRDDVEILNLLLHIFVDALHDPDQAILQALPPLSVDAERRHAEISRRKSKLIRYQSQTNMHMHASQTEPAKMHQHEAEAKARRMLDRAHSKKLNGDEPTEPADGGSVDEPTDSDPSYAPSESLTSLSGAGGPALRVKRRSPSGRGRGRPGRGRGRNSVVAKLRRGSSKSLRRKSRRAPIPMNKPGSQTLPNRHDGDREEPASDTGARKPRKRRAPIPMKKKRTLKEKKPAVGAARPKSNNAAAPKRRASLKRSMTFSAVTSHEPHHARANEHEMVQRAETTNSHQARRRASRGRLFGGQGERNAEPEEDMHLGLVSQASMRSRYGDMGVGTSIEAVLESLESSEHSAMGTENSSSGMLMDGIDGSPHSGVLSHNSFYSSITASPATPVGMPTDSSAQLELLLKRMTPQKKAELHVCHWALLDQGVDTILTVFQRRSPYAHSLALRVLFVMAHLKSRIPESYDASGSSPARDAKLAKRKKAAKKRKKHKKKKNGSTAGSDSDSADGAEEEDISPEQTELISKIFSAYVATACAHGRANLVIMNSLLHILVTKLDDLTNKEFNLAKFESFRRPVANPAVWRGIFTALYQSEFYLRRRALKDVNGVLIGSRRNIETLVTQPNWQLMIFPLLSDVPQELHSLVLKKVYHYTVNIFTLCHYYLLMHSAKSARSFVPELFESLNVVHAGFMQVRQRVSHAVLTSLLLKLASSTRMFPTQYTHVVWTNLEDFLEALKLYIFGSTNVTTMVAHFTERKNSRAALDVNGSKGDAVSETDSVKSDSSVLSGTVSQGKKGDTSLGHFLCQPQEARVQRFTPRTYQLERLSRSQRASLGDTRPQAVLLGPHWQYDALNTSLEEDVLLVTRVLGLLDALKLSHVCHSDEFTLLSPVEQHILQNLEAAHGFFRDARVFIAVLQEKNSYLSSSELLSVTHQLLTLRGLDRKKVFRHVDAYLAHKKNDLTLQRQEELHRQEIDASSHALQHQQTGLSRARSSVSRAPSKTKRVQSKSVIDNRAVTNKSSLDDAERQALYDTFDAIRAQLDAANLDDEDEPSEPGWDLLGNGKHGDDGDELHDLLVRSKSGRARDRTTGCGGCW